MIYELLQDFSSALLAMPRGHPHRHTVALLQESIRREIHFIALHPTTLFQCMWNSLTWLPSSTVATEGEPASTTRGGSPPGPDPELPLKHVLKTWRASCYEFDTLRPWLRSLRNPVNPLDSGLLLELRQEYGVEAMAISPDDRVLATSNGSTVNVWNLDTGRLDGTLTPDGNRRVSDVAFTPDGSLAIAANAGRWPHIEAGEFSLWDIGASRMVRVFATCPQGVTALGVFPSKPLIVLGCSDGHILVFNTKTQQPICVLSGSTKEWVTFIEISPDEKTFVSGSRDGIIRLWDAEHFGQIYELRHPQTKPVGFQCANAACFTALGQVLLVATMDGSIYALNSKSGAVVFVWKGAPDVLALAATKGDSCVAVPGMQGHVSFWDLVRMEIVARLPGNSVPATDVAFTHKEDRLVTVADAIRVWAYPRALCSHSIDTGSPNRIDRCSNFKNGMRNAFCVGGHICEFDWQEQAFHELAPPMANVTGAAISPQMDLVAFGGKGHVCVCSAREQRIHWHTTQPIGDVTCLAFSPDGTLLATVSLLSDERMSIRLWHAATGDRVGELTGHPGSVCSAAFSPTGEVLASSACDDEIRLWTTAGTTTVLYKGEGTQLLAKRLAFSPCGRWLFGVCSDGCTRKWDVVNGSCVDCILGECDVEIAASDARQSEMHLFNARTEMMVRLGINGPVCARLPSLGNVGGSALVLAPVRTGNDRPIWAIETGLRVELYGLEDATRVGGQTRNDYEGRSAELQIASSIAVEIKRKCAPPPEREKVTWHECGFTDESASASGKSSSDTYSGGLSNAAPITRVVIETMTANAPQGLGAEKLRESARQCFEKQQWEACSTNLERLLARGEPLVEHAPKLITCLLNAHEELLSTDAARIEFLLGQLESAGHATLATPLRQQHNAKRGQSKKPWWKVW